MTFCKTIAPLAFAFALAGCGGDNMPATPATFAEVKAQVFTPSCVFASCHDATTKAGNLDLVTDPYTALVNAAAVQVGAVGEGLKRVTPSDSAKSFLYIKMTLPNATSSKYGDRMPQTGMTAAQSQIDAVKSWIDDGAKNN